MAAIHALRRNPGAGDDRRLGFRVGDIADNILTGVRFYLATEPDGWVQEAGGGFVTASVPITAAQLATLHASPIELIATPGPGRQLVLLAGAMQWAAPFPDV